MRVAVVINGSSGTALGQDDLVGRLEAACAGHDVEATFVAEPADDLVGRLKAALALGPDRLVVGGGDGTLACAAKLLAGKPVAMGIIPLGTMNKLAKDLNIPLDPEAAIANAVQGEVQQVDVGEVNGQVFLRNSILGFASRVATRREGLRGSMRTVDRLRLAAAVLRSIYRYPATPLTLQLGGGRKTRMRTRLLAIANNEYAEAPGQIMAKSRLDRGELVLYHAPKLGVWTFVRLLAGMLAGDWRGNGVLKSVKLHNLVVTSVKRQLRVMNDGEPQLLKTPLRYRIRPGALTVVVPAAELATSDPPVPEATGQEPAPLLAAVA